MTIDTLAIVIIVAVVVGLIVRSIYRRSKYSKGLGGGRRNLRNK